MFDLKNSALKTNISRRKFIKTFADGMKVGLTVSSFPALSLTDCGSPYANKAQRWTSAPGVAKQRIEGLPKVLGHKIYARDFRAKDINGWPANEKLLYAVRCDRVDKAFVSLDLSVLPEALKPFKVIDEALINKDKLSLPCDMQKTWFVSPGKQPDYYGQPVALLIFDNFSVFRRANKLLQFNHDIIKYADVDAGAARQDEELIYDPTFEYVRDDQHNFNYVHNDKDTAKKDAYAKEIIQSIENGDLQVVDGVFKTQTMDPMFMEPEAGMAWFDGENNKLHLLLGTQSPSGDIETVSEIFRDPGCTFELDEDDGVELLSCFPGGGFGGRDSSYFPSYLALAAPYAEGPLRWAFTRFEQFQVGLKRHFSQFSEALAFDANGKISAMVCDFTLNGGGRRNLSPYVAQLAALSSPSAYNIPRAVAKGKALNTRDLIGGSQRGFGGPQAFIAIETLMDEASEKLNINPFQLRRINALNKSGKTVTGAPVLQELRIDEILNLLESQPLWANRRQEQQRQQQQGRLYGVGLAMSNQAYGTSGDGMYGAVEINADGSIKVRSPYIDMGNGAATSLGLGPATWLGQNASEIVMGEACFFNSLGLTTSRPHRRRGYTCDATSQSCDPKTNPKCVIKLSGSSSACLGAFYQQHAVEQAGLVLLLHSVIPILEDIWGEPVSHKDIAWTDNLAHARNLRPVHWNEIHPKIRARNLPTISAVHASFVGEFATADYTFGSISLNLPLDYVAVGNAVDQLNTVKRANVVNPPEQNYRFGRSTYAPSGALMAVSVDPKTGHAQVEDAICVVNAGRLISPQLVSGQYQGAVAMAIGYTLKENAPNTPDGPGNGTWNLDKYHVSHMADVPKRQELIALDPDGETTGRGIAESVMCPLPPAILNALAMATNTRFKQLPVTADIIKNALA